MTGREVDERLQRNEEQPRQHVVELPNGNRVTFEVDADGHIINMGEYKEQLRESIDRLEIIVDRLEERADRRENIIDRLENTAGNQNSDLQPLINELREQLDELREGLDEHRAHLDRLREIFDDLSEDDNTSETGSLSSSESSRVGDVDSNQQVVKRNSAEHRANDQENDGEVELEEDLVESIHCNHNNDVAG